MAVYKKKNIYIYIIQFFEVGFGVVFTTEPPHVLIFKISQADSSLSELSLAGRYYCTMKESVDLVTRVICF